MARRTRNAQASRGRGTTNTAAATTPAPDTPSESQVAMQDLAAAIRELAAAVQANPVPDATPSAPAKKKAPAKKAAAKKAPAKRGGAAKSEEDQLKDLESRAFDLMEEELTENGHVIKDMDNDAYDEEIQTIVNDLMGEEVPVAELNAEDFQTIINAYNQ